MHYCRLLCVLRVPIIFELLCHVQNSHICYKAEKEDEARNSEQEAVKFKAVNQIADEEKIKAEELKELKKKEGKLNKRSNSRAAVTFGG